MVNNRQCKNILDLIEQEVWECKELKKNRLKVESQRHVAHVCDGKQVELATGCDRCAGAVELDEVCYAEVFERVRVH